MGGQIPKRASVGSSFESFLEEQGTLTETTNRVVEHQIDVVVIVIEGETALPSFEQKAFAKFQQERLQLVDDRGFEIAFAVAGFLFQVQEFEHERVLDQIRGLGDDLAFGG